MNFLDFFREDKPFSSMRLIQFVFFAVFTFMWVYVSFKTKLLAEVPPGLQFVIGALLTGKVLQKGIEVWQDGASNKDKVDEDNKKGVYKEK